MWRCSWWAGVALQQVRTQVAPFFFATLLSAPQSRYLESKFWIDLCFMTYNNYNPITFPYLKTLSSKILVEQVQCLGGYNWLVCGIWVKEEKNMVAPPLGKAGLGGWVLCRGVLLLGCCGAGGAGPSSQARGVPAAAIRDAACPLWSPRAVALQILFSTLSWRTFYSRFEHHCNLSVSTNNIE